MAREESHNSEEIEVIMTENGTVDINVIHGGNRITSEPPQLNVEEAVCEKSDSSSIQEPEQDETIAAYPSTVLMESEVVCPEEPMEQPNTGTLPILAMAPVINDDTAGTINEGDEINQAWFTTKEEKDGLHVKGVKWRQGMWANDEVDLLKDNIMNYCKARGIPDPRDVIFRQSKEERKSFYRTIAKGIHRPLFAIYRRVLRTYENGNNIGKYSSEEVELLKELKEKHGNDWSAIGLALGRSASSVKDRCRLLNEKCTIGKWTEEEEQRLSNAVHQQTQTKPGESVTTGILWTSVAKLVATRSEKQCRSKWLNYLNWKECGGKEWNKFDEIDLIKKVCDLGVESENEINWAELANGWTSVRSPQWLRSKWWTIKKHAPTNMPFRDIVAYLNSNYTRNLRHRLDHHDPRYVQIPTMAEQQFTIAASLLNTPATLNTETTTSSVGQTIAVDGEIFLTRSDDKGADGMNTFEMVQLRALPNTDPTQPTSYIIEPIHCSLNGSSPSYILHQATPNPASKLIKIAGSSNIPRQVVSGNDDTTVQDDNISGVSLLNSPTVVSSLSPASHADVTPMVTTVTLTDVTDQTGSTVQVRESYVVDKHVDILEGQHQPLHCMTPEQGISALSHQGQKSSEELQNDVMSSHRNQGEKTSQDAPVSIQCPSLTSVVSQPLDLHFSTTHNPIYTHSLIPGLVRSAQTTASQIASHEVVIAQPTLPENILQSQGDEPGFLPDSVMPVPSPLSLVAGSLGEVTVSNTTNQSDLMIQDDFGISQESTVTMETERHNIVLG